MASAQCSIDEKGNITGTCTPASGSSNSGMFVGSSNTGLTNVDFTDYQKWDFKWNDPTGASNVLRPKDSTDASYNNLSFAFGEGSNVGGAKDEKTYNITIGNTNKVFLLNAGDANTLGSNLSVDFASSQNFTYYLNAKKLDGNLTLSGGGNFTAYLTDGITGTISNTGTNATFNINGSQASIGGAITANTGGTNHFNIIGTSSGTAMEVTGAISGDGTNNFTLNATNGATKLTLNGANNTIDTFTALGGNTANHNRLDFDVNTTGTKEIKELILGNDEIAGLLTITNGIGSILTIGTFESKYTDSKLTLNMRAKVNIENIKGKNNNIEMGSDATLTLNGGVLNSIAPANTQVNMMNIIFAKGETTIAKGLSAADSVNRNFTLKGSTEGEGTKAIINGEIALGSAATIPTNKFTLDSSAGGATNLTLGGAGDKTLTSLTALGGNASATTNTLTIAESASGANEIKTLKLGDGNSGGSPTTTGFLTITNNSNDALTIGTFTSAETDNVLTIAKGEVAITNALTGTDTNKFALKGATLTLNNTTGGNSTITSLTTTGTNNINFVKDTTTINAITGDGTNNFKLTSTSGTTSAVFEGAIGGAGANNFTLDSTAGATAKTSLTLQGTTGNAINDFTALGGTDADSNKLIIDTGAKGENKITNLVLGAAAVSEGSAAEKGLLTISNNAENASGAKVALTITNLTANGQDSKLVLSGAYGDINAFTLADGATLDLDALGVTSDTNTLNIATFTGSAGSKLTISTGAVEIKTLEKTEAGENNIALGADTALTLNGGTLKGLTTKGITAINFAKGNTAIEEAITAGTQNNFKLTSTGSDGTSTTFGGDIGGNGTNNFTLDSSAGATTTLNLKGTSNAINAFFALGGANTLIIGKDATTKNKISTLNLGKDGGTTTGSLIITNNSENVLTIDDFESRDTNNVLTITGGVTFTSKILGTQTNNNIALSNATLTLTDGGNLNKLETTATGTNTIHLDGDTTISEQISAGSGVTNNFHIGKTKQAALTLTNGFSTNSDGKNSFTIYATGTLNLNNQLDNGLTTTNGTTEFIIKENANFDQLKGKAITANTGGTNIITSDGAITLGNIKAEGSGSKNEITINGGDLQLGAVTSNGGENSFTIGNGQTAASLTLDTSTGVTTTNGGTTSFTVRKSSTLTLNGTGSTLTANGANNVFIIENGATVSVNGGNGFYDTITATGGGKNIIKTSANLNLNALTANGGINDITLKGTTGNTTTMEITGAISGDTTGKNNFILDSNGAKGDKTNLTLKGASDKTITSLTALSNDSSSMNTLTINADATGTNTITNLVLGDSENGGKAGLLTIDNKTTGNALTITNFEGKHTESKLTISAGEVAITNALTGANNNIALTGATLTLNGGTLKSLTTTGTNNTINLTSGDTIITSAINAGNGVTNTFTLTNLSTTFGGNISGSGTNNFTLDSATLHLKGNSNAIAALTLKNKNAIIFSHDPSTRAVQDEFRLLTIGNANKTNGTGLIGNEGTTLTFESYINPKADQATATLGNKKPNEANNYGYAYSDRVIIHNAGENQTQAQGTYNFKAYYSSTINESDLKNIKYTEGGTEVKGNIALFTIAKTANGNQGIIEFGTQDNNPQIKSTTRAGLDAITTTLTQIETDQYGKTNVIGNKNYLTYFVNQIQQDSGNDEAIDIIEDSNLMIQSMAVSAVNLYLANFNSLNKRMGELRDNAYSKGVWARTFIGSQNNNLGLSDQMEYFSLQAGFDGTIKTEKANNFIGFAISYSKNFGYSSTKNSARTKGLELGIDSLNSQLLEMAFYNSYVANEGWYNDTIGKLSYIQNSMTLKDQASTASGGINGASGEFNTFAFTLSNEVGYRAKLGEDKAWFIDPQAEVAIGYIDSVDFSLNHNSITQANATISSAINIRARAGASIGYDFKNFTQDKGIDAKLYVGAFYEMDSFHYTDGSKGIKYTTKLKDSREVKMLDTDHRAVLNVGTNLTIKKATRLYLDFEKSFAGKITTDYKINAGVRYSFGEEGSEKGNKMPTDEAENTAPLKLEGGKARKD